MSKASAPEDPVAEFSGCHRGIVTRLDELAALPPLVEAAERARRSAGELVIFFDDTIENHHRDEERELFPAAISNAAPDDESDRVRALVDRLKAEHLSLESQWGRLRPQLRKAARGEPVSLDTTAVEQLVAAYHRHADFEEREFLPLARDILARESESMALLGQALHLRRTG